MWNYLLWPWLARRRFLGRFDVKEVILDVSVEAAELVDLTVAMVGAVTVPAVAIMTVDAAAEIVGGN